MMTDYFNKTHAWFVDKKVEPIENCLICGSNKKYSAYPSYKCIKKCDSCGFVWEYEQPTKEVLEQFYQESDAIKHWSLIKKSYSENIRQKEKFSYVWDFVRENKIYSILDVGCGNGFFLNNVDDKVKRIGIEPSLEASKNCDFPVFNDRDSFFESMHGKDKYDMITMFGVVEHLKSPLYEIAKYNSVLADGGYFCIIVPNVDSLVVKTLGAQTATFCPQHLWYFDIFSLTMLMQKFGFMLDHYITVESEIQPILKKLRGFDPYTNIRIELTDRDITEQKILDEGLGYKICAMFKKEVQ